MGNIVNPAGYQKSKEALKCLLILMDGQIQFQLI